MPLAPRARLVAGALQHGTCSARWRTAIAFAPGVLLPRANAQGASHLVFDNRCYESTGGQGVPQHPRCAARYRARFAKGFGQGQPRRCDPRAFVTPRATHLRTPGPHLTVPPGGVEPAAAARSFSARCAEHLTGSRPKYRWARYIDCRGPGRVMNPPDYRHRILRRRPRAH